MKKKAMTIKYDHKNNVAICVFLILIAFHAILILHMFKRLPVGAIASALIMIGMLASVKMYIYQFNKKNSLFIVFFSIILLSLFNYVLNPTVIQFTNYYNDTFFKSVSYLVIPPLFFFIAGREIQTIKSSNVEYIIDRIVLMNAFSVVIGILLFVTIPSFYRSYVSDTLSGVYDVEASFYPRLFGYFGNAMMFGVICSSSIPLVFNSKRSGFSRIVLIAIFILGSIMTLQRGSWISSIFGLVMCITINLKANVIKKYSKPAAIIFILVIVTLTLFVLPNIEQINNNDSVALTMKFFEERFSTIGSMVSERSHQWNNVSRTLADYPFGLGIGMLSHVTASKNFELAIPDGNYFRILGELGPYGLIVFVALLVTSVFRGLRYGRPFLAFAILVYSVQAIGTNVFDFYYTSYVFWLLLGILSSTTKKGVSSCCKC